MYLLRAYHDHDCKFYQPVLLVLHRKPCICDNTSICPTAK